MNALETIQLINLLSFSVGVVLYALLLVMTFRHRVRNKAANKTHFDLLLPSTAILGLLWNGGELFALIGRDFDILGSTPFLSATTHAALGFLPAVVVHSTLQTGDKTPKIARFFTFTAYGLSLTAAVLYFVAAFSLNFAPSALALQILTFGYLLILAALFWFTFRQTFARRTVLATALVVFAISSLHLSHPLEHSDSWFVEFVGHQSSLPLAIAILYQDFRFAFADLFLKRALSILMLTATAFGLYVFVAAPLLANQNTNQIQAVAALLILWILTALIYPKLHDAAVWFVDKIMLQRVNYQTLRHKIAREIAHSETPETVLNELSQSLKIALTADAATWHEVLAHNSDRHFPVINSEKNSVEICISTAEAPFYHVTLEHLAGGRRLLSDEMAMLEDVALAAARRIDALRVSHERCEQTLRENEISKLASEAELRALRAQINPHFLFNALTTIGYLIQTAPDKALETLLRLTQLLRGVLRSTGEFSSLEEEIKLIESYLEIEKARFEERLQVKIEIAPELLQLRVPSLILQPLVENAVKHGISARKDGGKIIIRGRFENQNLILEVKDTGAGVEADFLEEKRKFGVGLQNVEARLRSHFGGKAKLEIKSQTGKGTTAQIVLPINKFQIPDSRFQISSIS